MLCAWTSDGPHAALRVRAALRLARRVTEGRRGGAATVVWNLKREQPGEIADRLRLPFVGEVRLDLDANHQLKVGLPVSAATRVPPPANPSITRTSSVKARLPESDSEATLLAYPICPPQLNWHPLTSTCDLA